VVAPREPQRVDLAQESQAHPVRFHGRRGGVSVWLTTADPEQRTQQAQTNVLAAILELGAQPKLAKVFTDWGVYTTVSKDAPRTIISDGTRTVSVNGDYVAALDAIASAFREAVRVDPKAGDYLLSLGIRAYLV